MTGRRILVPTICDDRLVVPLLTLVVPPTDATPDDAAPAT
eukprot:CAMPEP_0113448698 /NCGR_PEP_ID=MMETSP0014_2-20120614/4901_1 /TAXON_ID=2857 /ORGANISM="Nitzschia sp." /LENGTH=39 /DNA_ID=CAMNT_0000339919 /DNA_START=70 /DNA_END=185 /DNA_ORIENTATION=- /assembly_acc=CAM_ASM_000159